MLPRVIYYPENSQSFQKAAAAACLAFYSQLGGETSDLLDEAKTKEANECSSFHGTVIFFFFFLFFLLVNIEESEFFF